MEAAWLDARGREDGWNGRPWTQMYRDESFAGDVYRRAYRVGELQKLRDHGDHARWLLYPTYRDALLLDRLGKRMMHEIDADDGGQAFVRIEDEDTGTRSTIKTDKLAQLRYELDGDGPSRFGLTERQRKVFGCYWGTSDMTVVDIAKRLKVSEITIKREMKAVRERLAQAGIQLPAQSERRGRKPA